MLASRIRPRNQVLPLIAPHFTDRYSGEAFLIYDATHGDVYKRQAHSMWDLHPPFYRRMATKRFLHLAHIFLSLIHI